MFSFVFIHNKCLIMKLLYGEKRIGVLFARYGIDSSFHKQQAQQYYIMNTDYLYKLQNRKP